MKSHRLLFGRIELGEYQRSTVSNNLRHPCGVKVFGGAHGWNLRSRGLRPHRYWRIYSAAYAVPGTACRRRLSSAARWWLWCRAANGFPRFEITTLPGL